MGTVIPALVVGDDGPIASVSLRIDRASGSGELGYWIDQAAEGRGIITRAAAALVDHATSLGLEQIDIRAAVANRRSRAVAERLGFTLDRTVPGGLPVGDRRLDLAVYTLTLPAPPATVSPSRP
ncbi:MAG: GNAT family protein, partial [Herbiconiux sp.]|nr:GNAT family protein [Herbiconiux sp.]